MTKPRFSLLHIEDDPLWQTTVAGVLRTLPEVKSCDTVATASAAIERMSALRPGIVLLDVVLTDGDGLRLARDFAELPEPPRIILLSVRRDDAVLQAASEAHIAGLLWKAGDALQRLPEAIRTVAAGSKYYPPDVREALRKFRADPHAYFKILSDREQDLLPHLAGGASDDEVATIFRLSVHTVKTHRQSILTKLNLRNTAQLIHWAIQRGFVRPPSDGWTAREDSGSVDGVEGREGESSDSSYPLT